MFFILLRPENPDQFPARVGMAAFYGQVGQQGAPFIRLDSFNGIPI
jgi:hypothetical protein